VRRSEKVQPEIIEPAKHHRPTIVALVVIVLLGIVLRLLHVDVSLWVDELHSSWSVAGSFAEVAPRAAAGNQAPVYYWLLWIVQVFLGDTEFSLRLISIIAGVALIVFGWYLVRKLTRSDIAALATAACLAFDDQQYFYSNEVRVYIVVTLVGLLQFVCFTNLVFDFGNLEKQTETTKPIGEIPQDIRVGWRTRLLFIGLTVLLFYLHFTTALLLFAEAMICIAALLVRQVRQRYSPAMLLIDGAIIAVCFVPAVFVLSQIGEKRTDWSLMVQSWPISDEILKMLVAYSLPVGLVTLIWICGRGMTIHKQRFHFSAFAQTSLFAITFLLMLICVWLLTHFQIAPLLLLRYLTAALALPLISLGLAIGMFRNRWIQSVLAIALLAAVLGAHFWFSPWAQLSWNRGAVLSPMPEEDWRGAVAKLNSQQHREKQTLYLLPGLVEDHRLMSDESPSEAFIEYCRFPVSGNYRLDREKYDIVPLTSLPNRIGVFTEQQVADLRDGKTAWIISRSEVPSSYALSEMQQRLLPQNATLLQPQVEQYGNVFVLRIAAVKLPVKDATAGKK
jgi:type IV secretory pathway VirB2 component (pilin)